MGCVKSVFLSVYESRYTRNITPSIGLISKSTLSPIYKILSVTKKLGEFAIFQGSHTNVSLFGVVEHRE